MHTCGIYSLALPALPPDLAFTYAYRFTTFSSLTFLTTLVLMLINDRYNLAEKYLQFPC